MAFIDGQRYSFEKASMSLDWTYDAKSSRRSQTSRHDEYDLLYLNGDETRTSTSLTSRWASIRYRRRAVKIGEWHSNKYCEEIVQNWLTIVFRTGWLSHSSAMWLASMDWGEKVRWEQHSRSEVRMHHQSPIPFLMLGLVDENRDFPSTLCILETLRCGRPRWLHIVENALSFWRGRAWRELQWTWFAVAAIWAWTFTVPKVRVGCECDLKGHFRRYQDFISENAVSSEKPRSIAFLPRKFSREESLDKEWCCVSNAFDLVETSSYVVEGILEERTILFGEVFGSDWSRFVKDYRSIHINKITKKHEKTFEAESEWMSNIVDDCISDIQVILTE